MGTSGVLALPLSLVSFPPGTPGMPAGVPPHGMYGNISSTMTCENENQADVTMIREGSVSHMLLPNDGQAYTEVARVHLDGDVSLPPGGKVTFTSTAACAPHRPGLGPHSRQGRRRRQGLKVCQINLCP